MLIRHLPEKDEQEADDDEQENEDEEQESSQKEKNSDDESEPEKVFACWKSPTIPEDLSRWFVWRIMMMKRSSF